MILDEDRLNMPSPGSKSSSVPAVLVEAFETGLTGAGKELAELSAHAIAIRSSGPAAWDPSTPAAATASGAKECWRVRMPFTGESQGEGILLMSGPAVLDLVEQLSGRPAADGLVDALEQSSLMELSGVVLGHCLTTLPQRGGGRCRISLPDGVLVRDSAGSVSRSVGPGLREEPVLSMEIRVNGRAFPGLLALVATEAQWSVWSLSSGEGRAAA